MRKVVRPGARRLCRLVATQGLPTLTTPCRDTGHDRDTRSKGLCRDRENLCCDPSHPIPAQAMSRCQSSVSTQGQEISFVIENFLSRQRSCGQSIATGIFCCDKPSASSRPHTLSCAQKHSRAYAHACVVLATAPLYRDTGDLVTTQS